MEEVPSRAAIWIIGVVATVQFLLFVAYGLFGYAMQKSNAQGRAPSLEDTLVYAGPCIAIALFAGLAIWAYLSGRSGLGIIPVFVPLALGAVLLQFMLV